MVRLVRLGVVAGLVVLGFMAGFYLNRGPKHMSFTTVENPLSRMGQAITLAQPAFAQTVGESFLEQEAGISCYVDVGQPIDLAKAKPLYKVLEDETDSYLIGTVELSGYEEEWWPHVWIHKDGWIVVYYLKEEPTSRLMDWAAYERAGSGEISTTTLREVLLSVASNLKLDLTRIQEDMRYYHWQYPKARKLLVVLDTTNAGSDTFKYTIPGSLKLYEASGSHFGNVGCCVQWSQTTIDGEVFKKGGSNKYVLVGFLMGQTTAQGVQHEVVLKHNGGWMGIALFFLYG
ncbi:MAG: hypothetical protein DRI26_02180 [Chloroflexi bacterium]|nr:MAG: hypothetical protein DRI26_02180 [Chloroflexota bacterium]